MKILAVSVLVTACVLLSPSARAAVHDEIKGCAAKQHDLQTQIDLAEALGNSYQQADLQTALYQVNRHCTDVSLRQERENKIRAAVQEVSEREADLEDAMEEGDWDKIDQRHDKLAQSRQELLDARAELAR